MRGPSLITLSLLMAAPAMAQQGPVSQYFRSLAKPGSELKLEEGLKRHGQWHTAQRDTWTWTVWQMVAGKELGHYISISGGHSWADFDKPGVAGDADFKDAVANILPHTEYTTSGLGVDLIDVSRPWPETMQVPMVQVLEFQLKPGRDAAFRHTIGKFNEAATKTSWPGRYIWVERVTGGVTPHYTLVLPLPNYEAMQRGGTSPEQVMETAWGRQDADALWAALNDATESITNSVWALRPDLSYGPTAR
jgi:hypothetical protein